MLQPSAMNKRKVLRRQTPKAGAHALAIAQKFATHTACTLVCSQFFNKSFFHDTNFFFLSGTNKNIWITICWGFVSKSIYNNRTIRAICEFLLDKVILKKFPMRGRCFPLNAKYGSSPTISSKF